MEFYLSLFDILGTKLLRVVEDSHLSGQILPYFISTFISLIPKSDYPISFNDFIPISLCNFIYKIIAKMIGNRLKLIVSNNILKE